jgi:hypothetical protein
MPKCRACDSVLTREEAEGGRCPVCHAPLDGILEEAAARPRSSYVEHCFFCRQPGHCATAYCRVGAVNYWLFFVTTRWLKIRCSVCDACRSRFQTVTWLRILIGLAMFLAPLAVCLGIYMPFFAANKDPEFQPGQSGAIAVAFGTLCFPWLLSMPLGFLCIRLLFTRRILPKIDPDTEAELRRRLGWWGMLPTITCQASQPIFDGEYRDM